MKKIVGFIMCHFFVLTLVFGQNSEVVIEQNNITLQIGNEITFSIEIENDQLTNFKEISHSKVENPIDMMDALENTEKESIISNELHLKFCYADFLGSKIIVLTTTHHLENTITFKAKMKIKGKDKFIETSITEKYPNVFSIEQWKDDITTIILYDFEIVKEKN